MGAYENPAMIVDTESGKYIQNLQENLAGSFQGYVKKKEETYNKLQKEIEKNLEKGIQTRKELAENSAKVNAGKSTLEQKVPNVDWSKAYTPDVLKLNADSFNAFNKGTGTESELIKAKLITDQTLNIAPKFTSMLADNAQVQEDFDAVKNLPLNKEGGYYMGATPDSVYSKRFALLSAQRGGFSNFKRDPYVNIKENDPNNNFFEQGFNYSWVQDGKPVNYLMKPDEIGNALDSMGSYIPIVQNEIKNGEFNKIKLAIPDLFIKVAKPNKEGGTEFIIDENVNQGFDFNSKLLINKKQVLSNSDKSNDYYKETAELDKKKLSDSAEWKINVKARAEVLMAGNNGIDAVALANTVFPNKDNVYDDTETFTTPEKKEQFIKNYSDYLLSKMPNQITSDELISKPKPETTEEGEKLTETEKAQKLFEEKWKTGGTIPGKGGFNLEVTVDKKTNKKEYYPYIRNSDNRRIPYEPRVGATKKEILLDIVGLLGYDPGNIKIGGGNIIKK